MKEIKLMNNETLLNLLVKVSGLESFGDEEKMNMINLMKEELMSRLGE